MLRTRLLYSVLCSALLALVLTGSAHAQTEYWHNTFGDQLAVLLESPHPSVRADAMRLAVEVVAKDDLEIDLTPAADALIEVYKTSPLAAHRTMAVAVLYQLDDEDAYVDLLRAALNEVDTNVRRIILHATSASRYIQSPRVASAYNSLLARDAQLIRRGTGATG